METAIFFIGVTGMGVGCVMLFVELLDLIFIGKDSDHEWLIPGSITSGVFGIMLLWLYVAMINTNPDKIVTVHQIEEKRNILFYVNRNNEAIVLEQNWQVIEPKNHVIRVTYTNSCWSYGIHFSDHKHVELVRIEAEKS